MRKIILSVISTLVVVGFLIGGLLLYMRGEGFSAREQPTWMERTMARNARKIVTPAEAKNLANPRKQQTAAMIPRLTSISSSTAGSVMELMDVATL